jgi:hypothetical protein
LMILSLNQGPGASDDQGVPEVFQRRGFIRFSRVKIVSNLPKAVQINMKPD